MAFFDVHYASTTPECGNARAAIAKYLSYEAAINSHTENGIPDLKKDVELLKAKIQEAYDKLHEDILVS